MSTHLPDYAGAIANALARLRAELSPLLLYHNVWHTEHDVMPAVLRLARLTDQVGDEEARLLEVAAAYHDIGLIEQVQDHELIGARVVAQVLPGFGFAPRQIETITGMLLATRVPQSPQTVLEQIIADADLDVLGRADFFERNAILRQELAGLGQPLSDVEWYGSQLGFVERHTYFTAAARRLRASGKRANTAVLRARLIAAGDQHSAASASHARANFSPDDR